MVIDLPWGLPIVVRPGDAIGRNIIRFGLYDLIVTETIWRMLDEGETALDIGANIGHMTSVMAARVGRNGRVLAFEPHPEIFRELNENTTAWRQYPVSDIDTRNVALSDSEGEGTLQLPVEFEKNRGTGFLVSDSGDPLLASDKNVRVSLQRLDDLFDHNSRIGTLKIVVEGHELQVLMGATRLMESGAIRDIIFEEHNSLPTLVSNFLSGYGYHLFYLSRGFAGPKLIETNSAFRVRAHEAPSYLATLDPKRSLDRFNRRGWFALKNRAL